MRTGLHQIALVEEIQDLREKDQVKEALGPLPGHLHLLDPHARIEGTTGTRRFDRRRGEIQANQLVATRSQSAGENADRTTHLQSRPEMLRIQYRESRLILLLFVGAVRKAPWIRVRAIEAFEMRRWRDVLFMGEEYFVGAVEDGKKFWWQAKSFGRIVDQRGVLRGMRGNGASLRLKMRGNRQLVTGYLGHG